jgi:hypothetical protein
MPRSALGEVLPFIRARTIQILDSLGITTNGTYTASGIGAGYGYKDGLQFRAQSATNTATLTVNEIVLREFTRGADASPVTYSTGLKVFTPIATVMSKATVGAGGFTASPGNSTLWRVFALGTSAGGFDLLASPFTSSTEAIDDLPNSEDIDSSYEYIRFVGTVYVDSSGDFIDCNRTGDDVQLITPEAVFTYTSLTTETAGTMPAMVPYGCDKLWVEMTTTASASLDMAFAIRYPSTGGWVQHQYQNVGFDAYGDAPTGSNGPSPFWIPWNRTNTAINAKSTKTSNASTGSQSLWVAGWHLKV